MRIADLYCGVGGASVGLSYAFPKAEIIGFDIVEQPHYPFRFIQTDALSVDLRGFDFVWASPPCQAFAKCSTRATREVYPDLIDATRIRLVGWNGPWIIENVDGAPIRKDLSLCGYSLGMRIYRHRHFECSFSVRSLPHRRHDRRVGYGPSHMVTVAGHSAGNSPGDLPTWRKVMEMDWPSTRRELANAVPPRYAWYIGEEYKRAVFLR